MEDGFVDKVKAVRYNWGGETISQVKVYFCDRTIVMVKKYG